MQLLCLTGAACSGKANSCLLPIHCHIPLQALCLPQFLRSFSSPPSLLLPQFLLRYILLNSNTTITIIWPFALLIVIYTVLGEMLFALCVGSSYSVFSGVLVLSHLGVSGTEHSSGYTCTHIHSTAFYWCTKIFMAQGRKVSQPWWKMNWKTQKNPRSGAEPGAQQPNTNIAISWDLHGNKRVITKMFPGRIQCVTPYSRPCTYQALSKDKFE